MAPIYCGHHAAYVASGFCCLSLRGWPLAAVLQETDVSLDSLDAIVCHAGADIWLSTGKEWASDDDWEHLIDFRWVCCWWQPVLRPGI